ncbi:MAG: DUF86 domain-containing protein [bacterium]
MSKRETKVVLLDIIESIIRIQNYTEKLSYDDFMKDSMKQDAVIRNFEIIGEAVKILPEDFKNKHSEIDWKKISGMRDRLIHFYFGVNLEIVWQTIIDKLPELKKHIAVFLESEINQS